MQEKPENVDACSVSAGKSAFEKNTQDWMV
jgi:hypothetical protein